MGRYQRGYIFEVHGAFHVRYRTEEIVEGKLVRKQRSHRLCPKDREHPTAASKSVRRVCDAFMATINTQEPGKPQEADITIAAFWEHTYWPFVQENLKPSTYLAYQQIWNQHLKKHFGNMTLREYRKGTGSLFITNLAKQGYARRTVQHVKNLASGIFTHAANLSLIELNPWHGAKVLGKMQPNEETEHYTLEEIENIITALVDHVDCQLIMALSYFAGLRKGEIEALQWGDIDANYIHVRRNKVRGRITTPKTKRSVRSTPIIEPVRTLLLLWRAKACDGWVFQQTLVHSSRKVIRPVLEKAGLPWRGFHAGRRGLGTELRSITGNSTAARDVLGHEDETVTQDHYEGQLPEDALRGMKQLEAKVTVLKVLEAKTR
jgi:integrase